MAERFTIPTCGDIVAGKYLIQEELGRGSYGVVFRARQLGVERDVALKTLLPQAFLHGDVVERFQREASLISRLQHPRVVSLYDFGESDGLLYMVMEFVRGRPLAQIIKEEAPVSPRRAVHILAQVLEALQAAHAQGIVHRDLKPENIVLCRVGEDPDVVKILDFGIAKLTGSEQAADALKTLTVQGYVLGTPYYMSPEVITGEKVTHQADLYAAGILLYEMLTGVHPFQAATPSAVLVRHLHDPIPPLPDAAMEQGFLGYAVRRALAKAPEARFADAQEFLDVLEGRTDAPKPPSTRRPSKGLWAALAFFGFSVLVSVGAGVLWWVWSQGQAQGASLEPDAGPQARLLPRAPALDAGTTDAGVAHEARPELTDAGSQDVGVAVVDAGQEADVGGLADAAGVAPPKDKPEEVATVRVGFDSEPPGALVKVNGAPACETPCARSYPSTQRLQVTVSKIGYKSESRAVALEGKGQSVRVKLKPGRLKLTP